MHLLNKLSHDLKTVQQVALGELSTITSRDEISKWHRRYLGRKGQLTIALRQLRELSGDERPRAGELANQIKEKLQQAMNEHQRALYDQDLGRKLEEKLDVSLPGRQPAIGHLHLSTQTLRRMTNIFSELGFQVYQSPEVETDEFNFGLLNIPPYHPARDMWDTFWLDKKDYLLRTHTSPGQIHAMREYAPNDVRVILPGKCYRYEAVSARAEHQFFQLEGLAIGKQICLTDLLGTLHHFAESFYGLGRRMRIRGSYFPFTEPSIEVDIDCILCQAEGCRVCKYSGWLEVAGAGMVHPKVLQNGGYDPEEISGFAFGLGIERPAMQLHGVEDIRCFYQNDLRFHRQF